ncbi:MAG: B12-binding domain-containing protein [Eubacteriaceae bacterium]
MKDYTYLKNTIAKLKEEEALEFVNNFMKDSPSIEQINELIKASREGLEIVKNLFEERKYQVGDLIFGGEILSQIYESIASVINEDIFTSEITIFSNENKA